MGNDDKVLSQAEIDALLLSNAPSPPVAKATAPPVQQVKISAAPPPPKVVAQQPIAVSPPPPAPAKAAAAPVKPPAAMPAPTPTPAPAPQPPVAAGPTPEQVTNLCRQIIAEQTSELQKTIQDLQKNEIELTIKVNKLNTDTEKMDQLEEKIGQVAALVKHSPKATKVLEERINEIYGLLETLRQHSDEDRIHDEFHCVNCHSKKLVAVHVKCTSCGTENWMGWFPDTKGNSHDRV